MVFCFRKLTYEYTFLNKQEYVFQQNYTTCVYDSSNLEIDPNTVDYHWTFPDAEFDIHHRAMEKNNLYTILGKWKMQW